MKIRDVFNKPLIEDVDLMEVNMSPSNLRKMAAAIPGALAGMEFEMIVPGAASDEDQDWEPDFDADESVADFDDIMNFFTNGDFGNSRRDVQGVIDDLQSKYDDYAMEKQSEDWHEVEEDEVRQYIEAEADRDEMLRQALEDMGISGEEIDAAIEAGDRAHSFSTDKEERVRIKETPAYHHWADADEAVDEMIEQLVKDAIATNDDNWQRAEDNWRDSWDYPSERDFLEAEGLHTMMDVYNEARGDISWPYMMGQNNGGDSPSDVAYEFGQAIGRPWNASDNYHGARREAGKYVVEPDGSLEPDDPSSEGGLEFVSPPLPVDEMLSDLRKVIDWAKGRGCYTNESTGLHMNVSVPNFSREKLDFVKLALFIGDEYILKQFDRIGNTYCKSAMGLVKGAATPEKVQQVMERMKQDLDTAASKIIHTGATSKYTSINTKDGYIEFRSPGGNWLDANMDQLETTLLRFVVGMDIALDENKYKQEYAKKFYKMIAPSDDSTNTLQYFARFSAGELPKAALRSFIKQAQLQRQAKREKESGKKYWWNVQWDNNRRMEVVAGSAEVAKQVAAEEWGVPEEQLANAKVTALRPYDDSNWEVYDSYTGKVVGGFKSVTPTGTNRDDAGDDYRSWRSNNGIPTTDPRSLSYRPKFDKNRYEIFNLDRNNAIEDVPKSITTDAGALEHLNDYLHHGPHGLDPAYAKLKFGVRRWGDSNAEPILAQPIRATSGEPQPAGSVGQSTSNLAPHGPGPWEIYRLSDGTSVAELGNQHWRDAHAEAEQILSQRREAPELYGVRTIPFGRTSSTPVAGSTQDLQSQRATPGTFTGSWKVMANGEEVYRFSGVGNAQSDANRVAVQWLRNNGYSNGDDVEVLPIMS